MSCEKCVIQDFYSVSRLLYKRRLLRLGLSIAIRIHFDMVIVNILCTMLSQKTFFEDTHLQIRLRRQRHHCRNIDAILL